MTAYKRQTNRIMQGRACWAVVLAAAFVCCLFCCGCRLTTDGADTASAEHTPSCTVLPQFPDTGDGSDNALLPETKLIFTSFNETVSGIELCCPKADAEGAERLNYALRTAALDFAQSCADTGMSGVIDFSIKYNDRGLLSLVFTLYGESGGAEDILAASFICANGKRLKLSDCFGSCDGSYRFALSDSVTQKAEAAGLTLISYLPPIDDSMQYYFNAKGITLVYHKYEICAAEAGIPEVFLGYEELEGFMGEDSPLMRIAYFDGRG